jgi:leucyl aminopeptidase
MLTLATTELTKTTADWLVIAIVEGTEWPREVRALDDALGGQLTRLAELKELPTKRGSTLALKGLSGLAAPRVLVVSYGPVAAFTASTAELAWIAGFRAITDQANRSVAVVLPAGSIGPVTPAEILSGIASAAEIAGLGQDLFKAERTRHPLAKVQVLVEAVTPELQSAADRGHILGVAVNEARDLVNRPPADITPRTFAQHAAKLAADCGLQCDIWEEQRLSVERMRALLAVAKGSAEPPRMVQLTYRGGAPDGPVLALVGKGVTFDSGGLSLKPTDGMLTMKCDMAGAATVLAAMSAIARLQLPVNVIGLMGLVENMPGSRAFKLGDILIARNGVSIEVLNTDAEGRLVLADVLSYAVDLQVHSIVDLATLTGACVVALGEEVAGLMTNHTDWGTTVQQASQAVGEEVWPLPMFDHYNELIKGDVGDIKNTGGRWGGAITAAKFLERFVGGKPWVHLDIAGPAFASSAKPHRDAGGTGAYVRTLVELARRFALT